MELTDKQKKNLLKLAEFIDSEGLSVIQELSDLEDRIDEINTSLDTKYILETAKNDTNNLISELSVEISNRLEELTIAGKENYLKSEELVNKANQSTLSEIKSLTRQLNDEISRVTRLIPQKADLTPLERRINEVERKIPSEIEEETPEETRDKLETLTDENRLNWWAINGLEDFIKKVVGTIPSKVISGGVRFFTLLNDTPKSYQGQAGKVVAVNSEEKGLEFISLDVSTVVQSVTGLNTDNTDPLNPVVGISVDGSTITGSGTPGDPLVSVGGGGDPFSGTEGSVLFVDTDGSITEDPDNFFFDNTAKQLRVGTVDDIYSESANDPLIVTQELDDYNAITVRNRSSGTTASADLVVSNDLDDGEIFTGHYGNLGVASSNYAADSGELVKPNDIYLEAFGGNLLIQAYTPGKTIKFTTGGDFITDLRAEISDSLTQFFANYDTDVTPAFTGGNWSGTNGWSVSGGELVLVSDASDGTIQPATPLTIGVGSTYKVTITTSAVSGTVTYTLGGVSGSAISGTTTENFITALTTDNFIITGLAGSTATITEITILPLIDDTGDVLIEGNLTIGSTLKTLSNEDVLNINGEGEVTFPNHLPFGPSGVSPTQDYHLVTKLYAHTLFSSGARFVGNVRAATTTALPANTYDNGTLGAGATLTGNSNGALADIDGVTLVQDDMVLVKNESTQANNGAYTVTTVGDGSNPYVLTRLDMYDVQAEIVTGTFFTVLEGDTQTLSQWSMNNDATITVGTTAITFAQLSAPLTYTGGDGIDVTSTTISVDLATTPGLEFSSNKLRAYTDETTIERSAGGIRVKDGGITASKLVGSGVPETPSGAINGVNDTFTVTRTPLYININGLNYYENNGYTLSTLTITLDSELIPPTGSVIRSHYI